jgi:DNA-binding FadR family transcriptional regulator
MRKTPLPAEPTQSEPRLYRVVAARIQDLIRDEKIQPGTR